MSSRLHYLISGIAGCKELIRQDVCKLWKYYIVSWNNFDTVKSRSQILNCPRVSRLTSHRKLGDRDWIVHKSPNHTTDRLFQEVYSSFRQFRHAMNFKQALLFGPSNFTPKIFNSIESCQINGLDTWQGLLIYAQMLNAGSRKLASVAITSCPQQVWVHKFRCPGDPNRCMKCNWFPN